jgi:adenylate cyclase
MAFRVGINLGNVIEQDDGTIYGDGANVAARLQALDEPGGVMISEDARRQVRNNLHIGFEDAGVHQVKNIADSVRTHRVILKTRSPKKQSTEVSLALPDKPSIAVLAFDNLSGDPEQEYFADGIAEDIIIGLSHDRGLFVIARNSRFTYKGQAVNVTQIGRDLGVRYVIVASVRKANNRVRITAQLIDAVTGNHLWAERYDRELENIFAIQDEITRSVVTMAAPELMSAETDRLRRKKPEHLDAWDNALRALWDGQQYTQERMVKALHCARKATGLNPEGALGFSALAWCRLRDALYGRLDAHDQLLAAGLDAANRAMTLDKTDAVAHAFSGIANLYLRRHDEAVHRFERAIELNPNFALAHAFLDWTLACAGKNERAIEVIEEALWLGPRDPMTASWFSMGGFRRFRRCPL